MAQGLNINRLVRTQVNLGVLSAARRGFGILLVAGDSNVINGAERLRTYSDLESVAGDFGLSAPEYLAAQAYFSQTPRPTTIMIGRWLRTATSGFVTGGLLSTAEQDISNWDGISDGSFTISVDGVSQDVTGLDFTSETNLNGVAGIINATLTDAVAAWDGSRFTITSDSTGVTSTMSYATVQGAGTDISALLQLDSAQALAPVDGFASEAAVEAAAEFANISNDWYGLQFAASTMPSDDDLIDVAAFIEGASISRIFGMTETNGNVLSSLYTTDLATRIKDLSYKRSFVQYSQNLYAVASMFGRAFSVNFNANRSTITLMYKQEPGIVAENLTETQATVLKDKRCNVFVNYQNDTAIIQYGTMGGDAYFDEIHGLDWFSDALQNAEYNLLYTSKTKIPQTDSGQNELVNVAYGVCDEAVNNGLVAPGQWNSDGFGQLSRGDFLDAGYYIYTQPIALQNQSIRDQRIAPPLQIALKLAGAFHELDLIVDVNR